MGQSNYGNGLFKQLQEVMERLDAVEKTLKKERKEHKEKAAQLNDRINTMEKENGRLKAEIRVLKDDNERMKRTLNNDSSNSSLPPSSGQKGKKANAYNGRTKSGKKCGGQKGHSGKTLTKAEIEKRIADGELEHKVVGFGKESGRYVSKYVLDLQIIPTVTELRFYESDEGRMAIPAQYQSDVTYGPVMKAIAVDLYSEGVVSNDRISEFLKALSGNLLNPSTGSIYGFCDAFRAKSRESVRQIEEELMNAPTLYTDATVVTVNGKQAYIRNQSTEGAVLYSPMEKKDTDTLRKTGILSAFSGTLVHDHEAALYQFGTGHGECNVHLLRYLKKNTEETGNEWSSEMSALLGEMNNTRKERIAELLPLTEDELLSYGKRYDLLVAKGIEENKKTKGRFARNEEKRLLVRLAKYKDNHLLFLHDFSVAFENNLSERDLRKCKNRQKIAGGFRKASGNEMYCNIMSIVETCKRKNLPVFQNIYNIICGTPAIF
jgi:hypothetical protein